MKKLINNMKKTLLKPAVYTTLLLTPLLYGCQEDTTDKDILSEEKKQTQILENMYTQDTLQPKGTKDDPIYTVAYKALAETNEAGDTAFYAGKLFPVHEVEGNYINSTGYVRDVFFNEAGCGVEDEIATKVKEFNDSLEATLSEPRSSNYSHTSTHSKSNNSRSNNYSHSTSTQNTSDVVESNTTKNTTNNTTGTSGSVLDSLGDYVDVENVTIEDCDTCATQKDLLFNAINADYKNK